MTDRDYNEIDNEMTESREFECALSILNQIGIEPPVDHESDWDHVYPIGRKLEQAGLLLQYGAGGDLREDPLEEIEFALEKFNR